MATVKSGLRPGLKLAPNLAPRLAWQARRLLRQAGAGAIGGAVAMALSLSALWHTSQLEQRQAALSRQLNTAARVAAVPRAPVASDEDGVAAFHAHLPPHDTIPDQLKELVKMAQKNGIGLSKADYKPEQDDKAGFLRYRITLPVKAEFAGVQGFLIDALQALPTLTLESVAFKREQIASGEVEARIQFMLLVRRQEQRR